MATRTLSMSNSLQPQTRQPGFFRRLFLLLLFTAGMVIWMSLLNRYQKNLNHDLLTVFAVAGIALATGLGARISFYRRHGMIRFITAYAMFVLGLFALGFLTNWRLGFGPLEFWRVQFDWYEIYQLTGGLLVILLSLCAWWRPNDMTELPELHERPAARGNRTSFHAPHLPRFQLPRFTFPESWTARPKRKRNPRVAQTSSVGERKTPDVDRMVISRPTKKPSRSRRRKLSPQKPELQLSVYQDHRCPFCLEEVKRNDSRGVKECPICHTLHHADCWNVTGMCQIPHLNALN
jgi:hypothetical protein